MRDQPISDYGLTSLQSHRDDHAGSNMECRPKPSQIQIDGRLGPAVEACVIALGLGLTDMPKPGPEPCRPLPALD